MKTLLLIVALFALQPAFAASSLTAHGDTLSDCPKGGGAPRHGDCPR